MGDALTKLCADGPLALRDGTVSEQGCVCSLSHPVGGGVQVESRNWRRQAERRNSLLTAWAPDPALLPQEVAKGVRLIPADVGRG